MFRQAFFETLGRLGPEASVQEVLWHDIAARYSEKDRHYHNLHHLDNLIGNLSAVKSKINDWDVAVLAVGYHDIIYDTARHDNEEASAAYARGKLSGILSPARLRHCADMILATKAHMESQDLDTAYFLDADLAILGAEPAVYHQYTEQIRQEYSRFPDALYKPGRRNVVQHFLSMPRLFRTEAFYGKYDAQAKANLRKEMERLDV